MAISKIIQKEKDRQDLFFKVKTPSTTIACHKHSLINLKEYLEGELIGLRKMRSIIPFIWITRKEEDIKALNEMIGRYE